MIDLIAHGLSLRIKTGASVTSSPQWIRDISAGENQHLTRDSAISAESASIDKKAINQSYYADLRDIGVADIADVAEYQPGPAYVTAETSRESCGLEAVACDACKYFTPDSIGDGAGIGDCAFGVKCTKEYNERRPLYRYAKRHCSSFSTTMSS